MKTVTFGELGEGQLFRFFANGSLLTKTSPRSYAAPQWGQSGMPADPEQEVIPCRTEDTED